MRIIGLDYGSKRTGVAISDGLLLTAQGAGVIFTADDGSDIERIKALVAEHGASEIVVGLPLNMDGSYSAQTRATADFVERLKRAVEVPVVTWDERLTSMQAERFLVEADVSRKRRRAVTDTMAAQLILQNYLDYKRRGT